ncbi:hypothetical protein [Okeania sp. SIO2C2]|uniref:hypothetical protein n=1 Tax=Okeania sp. SIO2C2 TaxID=2607787 RepID=UPI00257ED4B7|nr:hypothetical protein [Okeania sp. SIO2C2]
MVQELTNETKPEIISCPVASVLYSKGRQQLIWQQLRKATNRKAIEQEKNLNFL